MNLNVKLLSPTARIPVRATSGAAGLDLYSDHPGTILPRSTAQVRTGVAMEIPEGACGLIVGRSGLAKAGIDVGGGLCDPDFRGEVIVVLRNESPVPFVFGHGDRVAQLLLLPCLSATPVEVGDLEPTARGSAGLGSTGA